MAPPQRLTPQVFDSEMGSVFDEDMDIIPPPPGYSAPASGQSTGLQPLEQVNWKSLGLDSDSDDDVSGGEQMYGVRPPVGASGGAPPLSPSGKSGERTPLMGSRMASGVSGLRKAAGAVGEQGKRLSVMLLGVLCLTGAVMTLYVTTRAPPETYWYLPVISAPYRPDNVVRTPADIIDGVPNTERFPGLVEMPGRCKSRPDIKTIATSHVAAGVPGGWSAYFEQSLEGRKNSITNIAMARKKAASAASSVGMSAMEKQEAGRVSGVPSAPYGNVTAMDRWRRDNPGYKFFNLPGEEYIAKQVKPNSQMECESLCISRDGCHGYEYIPATGGCKLWRTSPSSDTIDDPSALCVKYYGVAKPNMARVVTRHFKKNVPAMPYVMLRGVGNDLPPRHAVGQGYTNVKFMLENHPAYEGMRTIWVLNRIILRHELERIIGLLEEHDEEYIVDHFILSEYSKQDWEYNLFSQADNLGVASPSGHDGSLFSFYKNHPLKDRGTKESSFEVCNTKERVPATVQQYMREAKNNYVMNNNGLRNMMMDIGIELGATWIFPWDGNCFITPNAWREIKDAVEKDGDQWRYMYTMMDRIDDNIELTNPLYVPNPVEEPQIIFRRDARERFSEHYMYGRRPKVDFIIKLGIPGKWDAWNWEAWEPDPHLVPVTDAQGPQRPDFRPAQMTFPAPIQPVAPPIQPIQPTAVQPLAGAGLSAAAPIATSAGRQECEVNKVVAALQTGTSDRAVHCSATLQEIGAGKDPADVPEACQCMTTFAQGEAEDIFDCVFASSDRMTGLQLWKHCTVQRRRLSDERQEELAATWQLDTTGHDGERWSVEGRTNWERRVLQAPAPGAPGSPTGPASATSAGAAAASSGGVSTGGVTVGVAPLTKEQMMVAETSDGSPFGDHPDAEEDPLNELGNPEESDTYAENAGVSTAVAGMEKPRNPNDPPYCIISNGVGPFHAEMLQVTTLPLPCVCSTALAVCVFHCLRG